jgi:tetratricopeptide (TPR) repeat protein
MDNRFEAVICLRDAGRIEDAIELARSLANQTTDVNEKASLLLSQVTAHCLLGNLGAAGAVLSEIKRCAPDDVEVLLNVRFAEGCYLIQKGDVNDGLASFESTLQQFGQTLRSGQFRYLYEDIQRRRAFALVSQNRWSDALPLLSEATTFAFEGMEEKQRSHLDLGICYAELGDDALAQTEFAKALEGNPDSEVAIQAQYRSAINCFRYGSYTEARQLLESILRKSLLDIPSALVKNVYEQLVNACNSLGDEKAAETYRALANKEAVGSSRVQ